MANRTVDLLDQSRSPSRTIVLLAMPAIIEQLLQTMVNYVDTAMVGSMGKEATAAVAVTTSLNWLVNGLMNAAGLGFRWHAVSAATACVRPAGSSSRPSWLCWWAACFLPC